nr:MAG TPA: hypothetical protein [Caudoviricetes sp.]
MTIYLFFKVRPETCSRSLRFERFPPSFGSFFLSFIIMTKTPFFKC